MEVMYCSVSGTQQSTGGIDFSTHAQPRTLGLRNLMLTHIKEVYSVMLLNMKPWFLYNLDVIYGIIKEGVANQD